MSNAGAALMRREDYKAVKRMNKEELTGYLNRIYERGYEAGVKAIAERLKEKVIGADSGAALIRKEVQE